MLKSPLLKYVAGPQTFAYMSPMLAGLAVSVGMFLWMFGMIAGFGVLPGLVVGIAGCAYSAVLTFREPHISNILMARQKFSRKTPGFIKTKGKHYVG